MDREAAGAQHRHRSHQHLDPEPLGEAAVVDDPQLALAERSRGLPPLAEDPLVRGVHHDLGPIGADPAGGEQVARLRGDEDEAVGEGGADPLLGADRPHQGMPRRAVEEGREELREGVVEVEDQGRPAQLRPPGGEDQGIGHVVDLDQVEGLFAVQRADLARRPGEELGVAAEVGAGAAARLAGGGPVQRDLSGTDREGDVVVEADAVDPVAALGQRPGLPLDPRVDDEVRVVDHADPQPAAPLGGGWRLSYRPGLQSS